MKTALNVKLQNYDFKSLFEKKKYAYFTKGQYNLNIIGVRTDNKGKATNLYDDYLIVIYTDANNKEKRVIYKITTEPGLYYLHKPMNSKGAAILVPNQYRGCWKIAKHKGKYDALCQAKPISVYRDNNKNDIYDLNPKTIDNGIFGINIHKSSDYITPTTVDKYSAGCQVFQRKVDFEAFMRLCKLQRNNFGNSFTYTLLNEKDLV